MADEIRSYLMTDGAGKIIGNGHTPDGSLPAHGRVCTEYQKEHWHLCWLESEVVCGPSDQAAAEHKQEKFVQETHLKARHEGLSVICLSDPRITGVYRASDAICHKITGIEIYISKHQRFPGSRGTELMWPDVDGQMHAFVSVELFQNFASVIMDYHHELDLYAAGMLTGLPLSEVTLP